MKKELTSICIALVTLSGCSDNDAGNTLSNNDLSARQEALIDELGGEPWGNYDDATVLEAKTPAPSMFFGRQLEIGDINQSGGPDIVTSEGGLDKKGTVSIKYENANTPDRLQFSAEDDMDNFGAALAVGKFCPNLVNGDVIIASAPGYNGFSGGFGFIYGKKQGKFIIADVRKQISSTTPLELAGMNLAVGDVNGDGKADLVYQATPLNEKYEWMPVQIKVILDVCNAGDEYTTSATLTANDDESLLGSRIYIEDLNNDGKSEIIILDTNHDNGGTKNSVLFFYKYDNGKFVQTRSPIVDESGSDKPDPGIASVAFSDLDNDGDLDLIVGESAYYGTKRNEGRVRTFTNQGAGKDFDAKDIKWSYASDNLNLMFGSNIRVADLNNDGVNDLIVGASGKRNNVDKPRSGAAYVFMGTKDGSIFFPKPFWEIHSGVSSSIADAFGQSLAVANIDKAGWMDIIVGAPGKGTDAKKLDIGAVHSFINNAGHCYAASGCFFENNCYQANEVAKDNKCLVCDPTNDNFGMSEVVCSGIATSCQEPASVCSPEDGCSMINKPDGTSCNPNTCTDNVLTVSTCVAGSCEPQASSCGNFKCDTAQNVCPSTCKTDADCANKTTCVKGVCTAVINEPPVIDMASEVYGYRSETVVLKPTVSDPNHDELKYSWSCAIEGGNMNSFVSFSGTGINYNIGIASNATAGANITCTLEVTDGTNTTKADVKVIVSDAKITIDAPATNSSFTDQTVLFSGIADVEGSIDLMEGKEIYCSSPISKGTWSCDGIFPVGKHSVQAVWHENNAYYSSAVSFVINEKPSITLTQPVSGKTYEGPTITFQGTASATDKVNVVNSTNQRVLCAAAVSKSNTWNCKVDFNTPGWYTVYAEYANDKTVKTDNSRFRVVAPVTPNTPPVLVVDSEFEVAPDGTVILDASNSYDEDEGDTLTWLWTGVDASLLSSTSDKAPTFKAPHKPNTSYTYTVTLTDSHGASVSKDVTIHVGAEPGFLEIHTPQMEDVLPTNDILINGSTNVTDGSILVFDSHTKNVICVAPIDVKEGTWECNVTLPNGGYEIFASTDENYLLEPLVTPNRSFTVENPFVNHPPVIVLASEFEAMPGQSVVLDASKTYDEDSDELTFQWEHGDSIFLSATDVAAPTFTVPETVAPGNVFTVHLTVVDSHNESVSATTTVKVIAPPVQEKTVAISSPQNGISVKNPVNVSGTASPESTVEVLYGEGKFACRTTSDTNGAWNCDATFEVGAQTIYAVVMVDDQVAATSEKFNITVLTDEVIVRPVITSPVDNEIVSLRPTISGTVNAESGKVKVWADMSPEIVPLCITTVQSNGQWSCTVGYDLDPDTKYVLEANWYSEGVDGPMSKTVTVTTESNDVPVHLISPAEGSVLPVDFPVIFSGDAEPGASIDVYVESTLGDTLLCTAVTNDDGYWACKEDIFLTEGAYTVFADNANDDKIIKSNKINFTVQGNDPGATPNDNKDVKGGSCSISTQPTHNFGWMFLLAGFAGFGLIRRRKEV